MKKILWRLDRLISKIQGYGWGAHSLKAEVSSVLPFISNLNYVIDVGGNKGLYTNEILKINNDAKVFVFEPSKTNISILQRKFDGHINVEIIPKAVSDENKVLTLYSNVPGSGIASLAQRKLDHFGITMNEKETVESIRLDDFFSNENTSYVDLLKLDIEGFELQALKGATQLLSKTRVVQFEFGGANIDTRTFFQDFYYFFANLEFELYRISPFGARRITEYNESMEKFITTNYLAVNTKAIR